MPDFHQGDSLPISFLDNVEPPLKTQETLSVLDKAKNAAIVPATLGPWLVTHREGVTRPLIDGFVNAVRMIPGTDKIGAIGFCWGGRYAILQAHGQSKSGEGSDVGGVDAAYAVRRSLELQCFFWVQSFQLRGIWRELIARPVTRRTLLSCLVPGKFIWKLEY